MVGVDVKREVASLRREYLVGVGLLFLAGLFWSLSGALIKIVHDDGRGPGGMTIAFYRSLFAGLFLLPLSWGRLRTLRTSPTKPWYTVRPAAIVCVILFAVMTACFVVANTQTEAANAIILQYTSTFWIFGLSPWILKERPAARDKWILCVAVTGIAIIFFGNASASMMGLINALAAGLSFGVLTMMLRRLKDANTAAVTVFNCIGSAVLILPLVALTGGLEISVKSGLWLVAMGVVQFAIPYYLYSRGLVRVPAHQAALITMIEPVLVPMWAYLATGETVPSPTVIGGGIILVTLVVFVLSARKNLPRDTVSRDERG